ncbi:ABC transporter ATP-binding protein [Kitasatospora sp. NPDC052868]|uniref:ABC transporter ATP-binding protein n=1 Tax=Kitasatospora sp. NPDC052868 TaxID=3364060 RepID=UPI0037C5B0BB
MGGVGADPLRGLIRERWRLLRLLGLARRGDRIGLLAAAGLLVLAAPLTAMTAGRLVGAVARAGEPTGSTGTTEAFLALGGLLATMLLFQASSTVQQIFEQRVAWAIDGGVRRRIRELATAPREISHLSEPGFMADAARATDLGFTWRTRSAGTATTGQVHLLARLVGTVAATAVLAWHLPLLALPLLVVTMLNRAVVRRQWVHLVAVEDDAIPGERKTEYWSEVAAGPTAGKEVRLFGLAGWIVERRRAEHHAWMSVRWAARRVVVRRQTAPVALTALSAACALVVPGVAAAAGRLDAGELATCLVAAMTVWGMGVLLGQDLDLAHGLGAVRALDRLEHARPAPRQEAAPAVGPVAGAVRFEDVSFGYPGASRKILDGLDLEIRPGEVLAVVGANGEGKTTLIKLLAGLHTPTRGRITVAGTDLTELDIEDWRRRIAVVFQDFLRYPASLRDNVALAAPERPADDAAVLRALDRAGAGPLLQTLPDGLDTVLWRGGEAGRDLSGGQWQSLVIARALYGVAHGRRLVVFDEPTANLDVRAETEFFQRVVTAIGDASAVLISHRLSTLRHADRIVVLRDGRIVESGRHTDLLDRDGVYAALFRLQSDHFDTGAAAS